ncbi:hypothetical protein [Herbaspirillum sp. VT-16-41]|uniref:hypothetical protein n=1 Tax=Herbaspirillum sp. VT-16-41 TaxID=1953765 RepID=UPI000980EBD8|nr:hypothetical protein [Herbaspirillum sp. VT-16-41]ONN67803.1 hypothetical protein BTM36_04525 [Herbaspirillum sp. VT-16-41]
MTTSSFFSENWPALVAGALAGIPTALASAWAFGSKLTEKWLDRRFQKSLQYLKHEQDLTIARLKVEVDSVLAAKVKIQAKEFETMTVAWEMMSDVMVKVSTVEAPLKIQSDLSGHSDADWEDVFEDHHIKGGVRREILAATPFERNSLFWKTLDRIAVHDANVAISETRIYLKKYGVFVHKEVGDEMESLCLLAKGMMMKRSLAHDQFRSTLENLEKFDKEFMPRYEALFDQVRARLRDVGQMAPSPVKNGP